MTTAGGRPSVRGKQLRIAREILGLSRGSVAASLGVTEDEVEQWETDQNKPDAETLWQMADIYHRSPDYFLKQVAETPREVHYRLTSKNSLHQLTEDTRSTIVQFEELCRWQHDLEVLTGKTRDPRIPAIPANIDAEAAAEAERERLGLGNSPIGDLRDLLDEQGARIFELPIPGGEFAGFSWWSAEYGPCVLLSASEQFGRRNFTLGHEYAHLLIGRQATICDLLRDDADEIFANRFSAAFLMPQEDVRRLAEKRGVIGSTPHAEELQPFANRYRVSLEAAGRRLEELGLIPRGATEARLPEWQTKAIIRRRGSTPRWRRRLGESYVATAFDAYSRGSISLPRLAQLLSLDIRKAQEVFRQEASDPSSL